MQILFDKQHTPLFDTGLTLGMRLLYTSVTWSYITNTVAVPCSGALAHSLPLQFTACLPA